MWYNILMFRSIGASYPTEENLNMNIITVKADAFGSNTYLLASGDEAYVVDPSVSVGAIKKAAQNANVKLCGILLTHGHFDHILSLDTLRTEAGIEAYVGDADAELLTDGKKNAFYSFFGKERAYRPAEHTLHDGDIITVGNETLRIMHTPGHTKGSLCFVTDGAVISGDTLFAEGIGRCDLYGGDMQLMRDSLKALSLLDGDMIIYPGHGEPSTLSDAMIHAQRYIG